MYFDGLTASIDNKIIPLKVNYFGPLGIHQEEFPTQCKTNVAIQKDNCDTIILKSGSKIICKVAEIGGDSVSYSICNDSKGQSISILKSRVSEIRNYNGVKIYVPYSDLSYSPCNKKDKKTERFGLTGFILSLIGLISTVFYIITLFHPLETFEIEKPFIRILTGTLGIIWRPKFKKDQNQSK